MRKFKSLWIVGICAMLFWGLLGSSDLAGQVTEIILDPAVPDEINARIREKISADHIKLDDLINEIRDLNENQIKEIMPRIEKDFAATYLKNPRDRETGRRGWGAVIMNLKRISASPKFSKMVKVRLYYKPHVPKTPLEEDIDFEISIMTTLSGNPLSTTLEGSLRHRRLCDLL